MLRWLQAWWKKPEPEALRGTPPVRREKSYAAGSGYVYSYFYKGFREGDREGRRGQEYLFEVSHDRRQWYRLSLFLPADAAAQWEASHRRELNSTEQYAIVKMSLFEAFEQGRSAAGADILIGGADIERHAAHLDF